MSEITAPFTITTPTTSIQLNAARTGEAAFTVFNTSGRSIVGRALIHQAEGVGQAPSSWFTIAGELERAMPAEGAEHYTVQVIVPPDVAAGSYLFRFDMVGVEDVNELHVAGPGINVQVPEAVEKEEEDLCRWCIPAAIAAVLLTIGGVIVFLLARNGEADDIEIPNVASLTSQQASDILVNACEPVPCFSVVSQEREDSSVDSGLVIETDPEQGTLAAPGTEITIFVSTGEPGIAIPDVSDMSQDEALSTLENACTPTPCFDVVGIPILTSLPVRITGTTPPAGTLAQPGSEVRVNLETILP